MQNKNKVNKNNSKKAQEERRLAGEVIVANIRMAQYLQPSENSKPRNSDAFLITPRRGESVKSGYYSALELKFHNDGDWLSVVANKINSYFPGACPIRETVTHEELYNICLSLIHGMQIIPRDIEEATFSRDYSQLARIVIILKTRFKLDYTSTKAVIEKWGDFSNYPLSAMMYWPSDNEGDKDGKDV